MLKIKKYKGMLIIFFPDADEYKWTSYFPDDWEAYGNIASPYGEYKTQAAAKKDITNLRNRKG